MMKNLGMRAIGNWPSVSWTPLGSCSWAFGGLVSSNSGFYNNVTSQIDYKWNVLCVAISTPSQSPFLHYFVIRLVILAVVVSERRFIFRSKCPRVYRDSFVVAVREFQPISCNFHLEKCNIAVEWISVQKLKPTLPFTLFEVVSSEFVIPFCFSESSTALTSILCRFFALGRSGLSMLSASSGWVCLDQGKAGHLWTRRLSC